MSASLESVSPADPDDRLGVFPVADAAAVEAAVARAREAFPGWRDAGIDARARVLRRFGEKARLADLSGANLDKANLDGADLCGCNLSKATLRGAQLNDANLSPVALAGTGKDGGARDWPVNLIGADLSEAKLMNANLRGARLNHVLMQGADLTGAVLCGAVLDDADLTGAVLENASLPE